MTPALLSEIGAALCGPHWRSPLADLLGVDQRTVQRWAAGRWPVPQGQRLKIMHLLHQRADHLDRLKLEL